MDRRLPQDVLACGAPARTGRVGVDACAMAQLLPIRACAAARLPVAGRHPIGRRVARGAGRATGSWITVRRMTARAEVCWPAGHSGTTTSGTCVAPSVVSAVDRGIFSRSIGSHRRGVSAARTAIHRQRAARRRARSCAHSHPQRDENAPSIHTHCEHRACPVHRKRMFLGELPRTIDSSHGPRELQIATGTCRARDCLVMQIAT